MSATAFQRMRREALARAKRPNYNGLKVTELKALLIEKDIDYDEKATKSELIKLLEGAE